MQLFPRMQYLAGGNASGFKHVVPNAKADVPKKLFHINSSA